MEDAVTESEKIFLTTKNAVFNCYMLCVCLLLIKMKGVILLTIMHRMKNKAFISPEDGKFFGGDVKSTDGVDRVRRAHLNDIENIIPFCFLGLLYIFTDPPKWLAFSLFIVFTLVRFAHTIVYAVFVVPQPTRAICFMIGLAINLFLAFRTMIFAFMSLI